MRKWTYLVAALLMGGVSTSLTSCIDNDEPAGITDLRGAKAELLRAKAAVEQAKVAWEEANAAYRQAQADIKAEEAKQEALRTALLEAQTAAEKASIEQEAAISAATAEAALKAAQEKALQANLSYQKTLLEVNLALATLKDDYYSEQLAKLLTEEEYKYTIPAFSYEKKTEQITGVNGESITITYYAITEDKENSKEQTAKGLQQLSKALANAQYKLAQLTQELAKTKFGLKPDDLQKQYTALKSYWEGWKIGKQEALEELKKIQGVDISAWEAEYDALEEKLNAEKAAKDAIEMKLAQDKEPLYAQQKELQSQYNEVSELKMTIPSGLETTVVKELQDLAQTLKVSGKTDLADQINNVLQNQAVKDEKGEFTINGNALSFKLSAEDKNTLLTFAYTPGLIFDNESLGLRDYFNSLIVSEENKSEAVRKQQVLAVNLTDVTTEYKTASDTWTKAKEAFLKVADTYKFNYGDEVETRRYENDALSTIKAQWEAYTKINEPTEKETSDMQAVLADYLAKRYELDAFDITYNYIVDGATKTMSMKDALKDATLKANAFTTFASDPQFGEDLLKNRNGKGLYGALYTASQNLFGEVPYEYDKTTYQWKKCVRVTRQVLVTYDEWKVEFNRDPEEWYVNAYENNVQSPLYASASRYSLGDGIANDYFAATWLKEEIDNIIAEQPLYKTLADAVEKLYDDNKTVIDKYNADVYAIENQMTDLENAAETETAKYEATIEEYQSLMDIMAMYTVNEPGTTTESYDFEKAITDIKNKIIDIEGGVKEPEKDDGTPTYVKGNLAKADEEIQICQNYLDALTEETYPTIKDATVATLEMQIDAQNLLIEALQAQFNAADKKRQQLLDAITNGTTIESGASSAE